jgi:glycosyltransferase involved in cell wall biosynthesis
MNNFMTYEYDLIKPSNLTFKNILMVGRACDKYKRFELGLLAFEYISQSIPESKMKIISSINETFFLPDLEYNLNSKNNAEYPGYESELEHIYKNASLHIIPSISESFSMVLCETKIFGIPNILLGLEYLSASYGGTIIIYDDTPESLAKESIRILKDYNYRKCLGEQARLSMKKFNNKKLLDRWIKLILSINNNKNDYLKMINEDKKISEEAAINILKNEVNLIRKREQKLLNITYYDILNLTYLKNIK